MTLAAERLVYQLPKDFISFVASKTLLGEGGFAICAGRTELAGGI